MAHWEIEASVWNDKGRVRKNNEDNFYLDGQYLPREKIDDGAFVIQKKTNNIQLYAVCDGMGGTDCGEDASFFAVCEIDRWKRHSFLSVTEESITSELRRISDSIFQKANEEGKNSGTTIVMALFVREKAFLCNVGDSRAYLFRDGILSQLSLDHSKVQRLISMGKITPEEARVSRERHKIYQYLGMSDEVRISPYYARDYEPKDGDRILLCSDGLSDMVEEKKMQETLKESSPRNAGEILLNTALHQGGRDNVTILLLDIHKCFHEMDMSQKRSTRKSLISRVLLCMQILVGIALILTILDLAYYLL